MYTPVNRFSSESGFSQMQLLMVLLAEQNAQVHPVSEIILGRWAAVWLLPFCAVSSVLNHCEVHHIAAVVYQCYSDVIGPNSITMEAYKPVLTKLGKNIQVSCN